MIDKNLNWQSHIKLVESKISKNIRFIFKGSTHLNKKCLSVICFSFMHMHLYVSYIDHSDIAWVSIRFSKCTFKKPPAFINYAKSSISSRRPQLWNTILSEAKKHFSKLLNFKIKSDENFFLLTKRWNFSRSKKFTRSNPKIMHNKDNTK